MRRVIGWYLLAFCVLAACTAVVVDAGIPVTGGNVLLSASPTFINTTTPTSTATKTSAPTQTVTSSPTSTHTPTSTFTTTPTPSPSPIPYIFSDTIQDAVYLSELVDLPLVEGANCFDPISYRLESDLCFEDFGDLSPQDVLKGPYYLGLFTEITPQLEFPRAHFYVFYMEDSLTHEIPPKKFRQYFWGKSWTRAKNENWVSPYLAWEISEDTYEKLVQMGREYDKDFWFESWGP